MSQTAAETDSVVRFHMGPAPRGPNGRAMYLWDTKGNYIELESWGRPDRPTDSRGH